MEQIQITTFLLRFGPKSIIYTTVYMALLLLYELQDILLAIAASFKTYVTLVTNGFPVPVETKKNQQNICPPWIYTSLH